MSAADVTEQQQDVEAVEDRISAEQTAAEAKAAEALLSEKESAAKVPSQCRGPGRC